MCAHDIYSSTRLLYVILNILSEGGSVCVCQVQLCICVHMSLSFIMCAHICEVQSCVMWVYMHSLTCVFTAVVRVYVWYLHTFVTHCLYFAEVWCPDRIKASLCSAAPSGHSPVLTFPEGLQDNVSCSLWGCPGVT